MPGTSIGTLPLPDKDDLKELKNNWYSFYNSAFLLGAALGGLLFGWIADWTGRVRAMGASILCYSLFAGAFVLVLVALFLRDHPEGYEPAPPEHDGIAYVRRQIAAAWREAAGVLGKRLLQRAEIRVAFGVGNRDLAV